MIGSKADFCWWVDRFVWTYDPRRLDLPIRPFVLFPRQKALAEWLQMIVDTGQEGVLEKSRDVGVSWICALFALHKWLFFPGFRTTFGSFNQLKVDQLGNSDSIFEKLRIALDMLPKWMLPAGWNKAIHDNYMRLLNPATGNEIVGEVGQNMGRGGRSTLFVVDEAAFVEHLGAALRSVSANADAKVIASTANGMANSFYVKREHTRTRDPSLLFRFHWRDDPRKGEAWADANKAAMQPEDWASEYEIDYGASVERQLIKAEWVDACHELARRYQGDINARGRDGRPSFGSIVCGMDLGGGKAECCIAVMRGSALIDLKAWRDPDGVNAAALLLEAATTHGGKEVRYDATGVGSTQGSIMSRMNGAMRVIGVNAGEPPPSWIRIEEGAGPDRKFVAASDRFANLKALGWWGLRERARASWEVVNKRADHPLSDCLLLAVDDPTLDAQLVQPTWSKNLRGKTQVDKAPEGTKSPDRADALVLATVPVMAPGIVYRPLLGV